MSENERILDVYESISAKTGEMLDAAKSSDWDRLVALEQDCRALIETLKRTDDNTLRPDPVYVQSKIGLIHKVLADDAEIRKFTEPWIMQLNAYLGRARQEQRLQRAYEAGHGS